jgi:hypothetical protein
MKIRQGFVSNSSSSSFVVACSDYDSIWDLAAQMVALREWDSDERLIEAIYEQHSHGGDDPENISFPTCNFSTFIHREGEHYWISTCNNHPFYTILKQVPATEVQREVMPLKRDRWGDQYKQYLGDYIEFYMEDDYDWWNLEELI